MSVGILGVPIAITLSPNDTVLIDQGSPPVTRMGKFKLFKAQASAPINVQFTDLSNPVPSSWSWNFGDGGTSTLQNPNHAYSAGTYGVTLVVVQGVSTGTATKANYVALTST